MDLSLFLYLSELAGTVAFAVSGVLTAKKQKLDVFGAVVLGLTTAVGGGALRVSSREFQQEVAQAEEEIRALLRGEPI